MQPPFKQDVISGGSRLGSEGGRSRSAQAEKWAKQRNKPIAKENSTGSIGQAVASDATSDDEHPIHLLPNPSQDGWVATQNKKRIGLRQRKSRRAS